MINILTTSCILQSTRLVFSVSLGSHKISVPTEQVVELANKLLSAEGGAALAGLGARDVLRLEARLCLYGNNLSEETTPIEAGLTWCISVCVCVSMDVSILVVLGKRRRAEGGFLGADTILSQLGKKPAMRRVGIQSLSGPPARSEWACDTRRPS